MTAAELTLIGFASIRVSLIEKTHWYETSPTHLSSWGGARGSQWLFFFLHRLATAVAHLQLQADWKRRRAIVASLLCQTLIVSHNLQIYGSVIITAASDWLRMSVSGSCCPGEAKLLSEWRGIRNREWIRNGIWSAWYRNVLMLPCSGFKPGTSGSIHLLHAALTAGKGWNSYENTMTQNYIWKKTNKCAQTSSLLFNVLFVCECRATFLPM